MGVLRIWFRGGKEYSPIWDSGRKQKQTIPNWSKGNCCPSFQHFIHKIIQKTVFNIKFLTKTTKLSSVYVYQPFNRGKLIGIESKNTQKISFKKPFFLLFQIRVILTKLTINIKNRIISLKVIKIWQLKLGQNKDLVSFRKKVIIQAVCLRKTFSIKTVCF